MDLNEVKSKKFGMEKHITELLRKFEVETGLLVKEVKLKRTGCPFYDPEDLPVVIQAPELNARTVVELP